jgi:hypothetical protein
VDSLHLIRYTESPCRSASHAGLSVGFLYPLQASIPVIDSRIDRRNELATFNLYYTLLPSDGPVIDILAEATRIAQAWFPGKVCTVLEARMIQGSLGLLWALHAVIDIEE